MKYSDLQSTDNLVLRIINQNLKIVVPLTADDINRSHIIGEMKDGRGQIICRFRNWKIKNLVYQSKRFLKSNEDKIFITEDLTRVRQAIVKQLNERKKAKEIHSFWTFDGRIFAKKSEMSPKVLIKTLPQVNDL